ncbi:multidrug ABC transporter permease, partial [Lacticaseibacillus rhamnosus]
MPPIIKHVLKKRTAPFIALILLAVTGTSLITGGTYLEGKLLDSLVYSHDRTLFVTLLLIILGIGLSRLIVSYFQNRIQILTRRRTILAMNRSILACLFTKKTLAILTWSPTTLSSRINDDVNEIVGFFADTVVRLIGIIVSTLTIALYVMKADAKIFGMMAIFVPIYFVIYVVFHQKIYAISLRVKNKQNEYFTARNDFIGRYIEIKGAGSFQNEAKRLNRVEAGLFQTYIRDFWIRFTMSASQISIQLIFQTCFFLVGGFAVLNGQITIGFFSIILQYFSQLLNSVDQLLTVAMGTEAYRASLARMRQILSIAPDEKGTGQVNEIHTIEVKGFNVRRFSQQPSNDEMFYAKNMNVSFRTPGLYVISGDNGIGK